MPDIASLIIRVTTNGADQAASKLGGLGKAALGAVGAVGALATTMKVFDSLVDAQRNFDRMNASLITMTGSTENAKKAFAVLSKFAQDTPYDLNQAVEGFTKLVALGLNPSKEALNSYGNTAAAMGKDLNQMIEAVADAATGEFERLKEFGIKASQQGDKVSFTFQGVTTTVKNNSEQIQQYLLDIGNTQFAGAMEERAKTLDGQLAALGGSFENLKIAVSQSGFGDAIAVQAGNATTAIDELTDRVKSGQVADEFKDWYLIAKDSFGGIIEESFKLANEVGINAESMGLSGSKSAAEISRGFKDSLPEIKQFFADVFTEMQAMNLQARITGAAVKAAFTPGESAKATLNAGNAAIALMVDVQKAQTAAEADGIKKRSELRMKESDERRKAYDQEKKQEVDLASLVKNKPGDQKSGPSAADEKAAKAAAKLAEQQRQQAENFIDMVKRQNQDELAAIDEQEKQKISKLDEFNKLGALKAGEYEATKTQIAVDAEAKRNEFLQKQAEDDMKNRDSAESYIAQLQAQNEGELAEIDRQNEEKLKKLEEFHKRGHLSEKQYQDGLKSIQEQTEKEKLAKYEGTLSDTTSALKNALGEGSALYKAAAITQTIIETYKGATAAYASLATIPIVGPGLGIAAAAAITASGLANVQRIRAAREQGGNLAAGQASYIAERGKAEVIMPAGASRVRTAQQMRQIMGENSSGKSGGSDLAPVIINQTTGRIDKATTDRDEEGRLRILIEEHVASSLQDSNSKISKSRRTTRGQAGY